MCRWPRCWYVRACACEAAPRRARQRASCAQDFGGFRLVAACLLPLAGGQTLLYGSADQARTVHADAPELNSLMLRAARALNLKPHRVGRRGERTLASCADIEVHAGRDGRWYIVDTARVFPPERPSTLLPALLLPCEGGVVVLDVARQRIEQELAR